MNTTNSFIYKKIKFLFIVYCFLGGFLSYSQLSNFSLNLTNTDETCTANGTLTIAVSGTTPGASMLYTIYKLPNTTTPLSNQSSTFLNGLTAATYRVIATQSLGGQTGTQQQEITILNQIIQLTYQLTSTKEVCGNDGKITVTPITGTAVSYEIFSGPMTRPLQTSPIFTGLTAGLYQIRVFDSCGEGVVQTYTLMRLNPNLNLAILTPSIVDCSTVSIGFTATTVDPTGIIVFPLTIHFTVTPPSGPVLNYYPVVTSGNSPLSYSINVPLFPNQNYSYAISVIDGCGHNYNLNGTVNSGQTNTSASYNVASQGCSINSILFSNVTEVILTQAPIAYTGAVPNNFTSSINATHSLTIGNLPPGNYIFQVKDICGNASTLNITIPPPIPIEPYYVLFNQNCATSDTTIYNILTLVLTSAPSSYTHPLPQDFTPTITNYLATITGLPPGTYTFSVTKKCGELGTLNVIILPYNPPLPVTTILEGCTLGNGSVKIEGVFTSVQITTAPTTFSFPLPYSATSFIITGGFTMDGLPAGNYIFKCGNSCGNFINVPVTITGYQETTNAQIIPHCGAFDINLSHTSNNMTQASYWLQKWDATNNLWVNPANNIPYFPNTYPNSSNSIELTNNSINYNMAYLGSFRILKTLTTYVSGIPVPMFCYETISLFDFTGVPKINNVYNFSCNNGSYDVVVDAIGLAPLHYRITSKDGVPFLLQNGTSSLFLGLAAGTYNFQVEDACGYILNSLYSVPMPFTFGISPTNFCNGQPGSLTVPYFSFLTYQWWKDSNPAIINTSNSLQFPSFNSALNSGTYHVRVEYTGNPNSCINFVLNYTISPNSTNPNAGIGSNVTYCGSNGIMNLFSLLSGNFDTIGTWQELTNSGTLVNNLWNSTAVSPGLYTFKYRVNGSCNTFDEEQVSVTIKAVPATPTATADPVLCETQNIQLHATTIPNVSYNWSGPNGFTATVQNPLISNATVANSGTYHVKCSLNVCDSGTSNVTVTLHPTPLFNLDSECVNKRYTIWATPVSNSYDTTTATYAWTEPNGNSSNQNQLDITNHPSGTYSLTITNTDGCFTTVTKEITSTLCEVPSGLSPNGDGHNEILDLTGLGVIEKFKIYNRYGMVVFEQDGYTNQWHGQDYNDNILPSGTYYYYVKLKSTNEARTGWIYLVIE